MWKDLRFSARVLLKQPALASIAIVTLALGIGATSAVFSLIQGVLLTPPPYHEADRLVLVQSVRSDGKASPRPTAWAPAQWQEWRRRAGSIEAVAAYSWTFNFLVSSDGSDSIEGMVVTPDYFQVLDVKPILGRAFTDADGGPHPAPVIVIGYDLWQRKFGGDRNVIGRKVQISRTDTPPEIIGVMPPRVRFLPSPGASQEPNYDLNAPVDFWMPARIDPARIKSRDWDVVARLRNGYTPRQAEAELASITASLGNDDRDLAGFAPRLETLMEELNRDGRRILLPLLAAAALVLLIACGNVAALLLVRGLQRQQEYAVRSALGGGRARLLRQVLSENLLLAICGGTLGIAIAAGAVRLFQVFAGHALPRLDQVTAGWPILACGFATAVAASVLAGALPAWRASSLDPVEVLKSAGPKMSAGRADRRWLRGVAIVQAAMTLALLIGTGLLVRTMMNLAKVQSGYHTEHVLTATVTAVQGDRMLFHQRALESVLGIPGVSHAAFAWGVPLTGNDWPGSIELEGQPPVAKDSDRIAVPFRSVTPGYFALLGQELFGGRDFRPSDKRGAPTVAIVNQALVDRYFAHANPIGKKIWGGGRQSPPMEIVGVVANGRTDDLTKTPAPEVYFCLWQALPFSKHLVVRTTMEPRFAMAAIQRSLRAVDPTVSVENVKTLDQIRDESLASRTFAMQLLVGFSLVGGVLTLVGIYGVLALTVASRRREIAIRAAVGAERHHIRRLVFAEAFRLIGGGVAAGIVAALVLSRVLATFLFGVGTADPLTFVAVALVFAAVGMVACWGPVRRAAKVDPTEALRYE